MTSEVGDTLTREYSQRLGVLTREQLQAALDRFQLGALIDAQSAPGGLFGQNVLLETMAGRWVLRGAPHYAGQFEKERFFSRLIHERTRANAPWPFHIEKSPDLFGWSYALMPQLPGEQLSAPAVAESLTPHDRVEIARAMGEHLAIMQEATWPAPATYDHAADDLSEIETPFADWFIGKTREWLAQAMQASGTMTSDDIAWIESIIKEGKDVLAVPFAPSIVHTDYAEGNIVAERTDTDWRVTGVFDLGESYIGDGEYDFARLLCWYGLQKNGELAAFVGGYTRARPLRADAARRQALYILHDRLILWEYGQRNGIWFKPGVTFRQFADRFVAQALLLEPE